MVIFVGSIFLTVDYEAWVAADQRLRREGRAVGDGRCVKCGSRSQAGLCGLCYAWYVALTKLCESPDTFTAQRFDL